MPVFGVHRFHHAIRAIVFRRAATATSMATSGITRQTVRASLTSSDCSTEDGIFIVATSGRNRCGPGLLSGKRYLRAKTALGHSRRFRDQRGRVRSSSNSGRAAPALRALDEAQVSFGKSTSPHVRPAGPVCGAPASCEGPACRFAQLGIANSIWIPKAPPDIALTRARFHK